MKVLIAGSEHEDYTIAFANAVSHYCSVELCLPYRQFHDKIQYLRPGVRCNLLDWPRLRNLRNLAVVRSVDTIIRATEPDIVHFPTTFLPWLSSLLFLRRGCPFVVTVHDAALHPGDHESQLLPRWVVRLLSRRADYILVHGELIRASAIQWLQLSPDRIFSIPHVVNQRYKLVARGNNLVRQNKRAFSILFFGRICEYKGLGYLLQTEQSVASCVPGVRYIIAGQGEDFGRYRAMMRDEQRFEVVNHRLSDAEVAQVFLEADVLVLPYIEASQSGVLAIAAAFGKPVIVSSVGELPTTVQEADMGIVVPPRNSAALADAILRLASNKDLRERYAANARAYARDKISEEIIGARTAAIYADLICRYRASLPG